MTVVPKIFMVKTKEEAVLVAQELMRQFKGYETNNNEIQKSLYGLAKRWRLSYSTEDGTVEGRKVKA